MKNSWTGGQYSIFRIILGVFLCSHFLFLLPWATEVFSGQGIIDAQHSPFLKLFPNILLISDQPLFVQATIAVAALASVSFALGFHDKLAALFLWYILACLFGRNPLTLNPSLPFLGWILLAHVALPAKPYGAVSAIGRTDPKGDWYFPPQIFAAAWLVMSVGYNYSGLTKLSSPSWLDGSAVREVLSNPLARPTWLRDFALALPAEVLQIFSYSGLALELLFLPLALFRKTRPLVWLAMVIMHLSLIILIQFAELSIGMLLLHLFTFNPAWLKPLRHGKPLVIFYDGSCGLCQRWVRFVLAEKPNSDFRFSAINSQAFDQQISRQEQRELPDSIIVSSDGKILHSTAAIAEILKSLGGFWRALGWMLALLPRSLSNFCYSYIAGIRHRFFDAPKESCPLMPADYRKLFLE